MPLTYDATTVPVYFTQAFLGREVASSEWTKYTEDTRRLAEKSELTFEQCLEDLGRDKWFSRETLEVLRQLESQSRLEEAAPPVSSDALDTPQALQAEQKQKGKVPKSERSVVSGGPKV